MKSHMIALASYIKDKESYSDLQVMHSGAGYYIGTVYHIQMVMMSLGLEIRVITEPERTLKRHYRT